MKRAEKVSEVREAVTSPRKSAPRQARLVVAYRSWNVALGPGAWPATGPFRLSQ
jgi:hypothetical protein